MISKFLIESEQKKYNKKIMQRDEGVLREYEEDKLFLEVNFQKIYNIFAVRLLRV